MIPILVMPAFQPGLMDPRFGAIRHRGISRIIHFSVDNRLMTKREIEQEITPEFDFFRIMQLDAFIRSKSNTYAEVRALTGFVETCLKGESMRHPLSHFYTILTGLEAPQELTFLQAWERDFPKCRGTGFCYLIKRHQ